MIERVGPCQAEYHVKDCECLDCKKHNCVNCRNISIDHLTPKCIAKKVLHWKNRQMNSRDNLQVLSNACHKEKDRNTPARFVADMKQARGGEITLEQVREWADESEYNH